MSVAQSVVVVNHEHTKQLIALGYLPDLLPIIPPGAALSPFSSLTADKIGKTPGRWDAADASWTGYPEWGKVTMTRELLSRSLKGAPSYSLGIQSRRVHAVDVDTDNEDFAEIAMTFLNDVFAPFVYGVRWGRRPGFLMPFQVETPRHKLRMVFSNPLEEKTSAIEILGIGQQFLISGIHPKTGQPYQWGGTHPLVTTRLGDRPVMPDADFDAALEALGVSLAGQHWTPLKALHAPRSAVDGQSFEGPDLAPRPVLLERLLTLLPNRPGDHRDRDEWVTMCHALVGATGKSEQGRELFLRWSEQWDGSSSAMAQAERLWEGVDPAGTKLGWRWLAQRMQNASAGRECFTAEDDFAELSAEPDPEPELDPANPFDEPEAERPTAEEIDAVIDLLGEDDEPDQVIALIARASLTPFTLDKFASKIAKATKARKPVILKMIADARSDKLGALSDNGLRLRGDYLGRINAAHYGVLGEERINYRYLDGVWQIRAPLQIRAEIETVTDKSHTRDTGGKVITTTRGVIDQAYDLLQAKGSTRFDVLKQNEPRFMSRNVLNLDNGTLWLHEDGRAEFRKHNPDDFLFHKIAVEYDPRAEAPIFLQALKETLRDSYYEPEPSERDYATLFQRCELMGATKTERVEFGNLECWLENGKLRVVNRVEEMAMLQELFGYALLGKRDGHALIVQGPGRNGKSELVRVIERLLGPLFKRCSLESLESPFQMVELYGVRTICDDDATMAARFPEAQIKNYGESKTHSVQVKRERNQSVTLGFFSITNCNNWPITREVGVAIQQRVRVLRFNRIFVEGERPESPFDAVLASKAELSGVLNWAVKGALAYMAKRMIRETMHSRQSKAVWLAASRATAQFVMEYCTKINPVAASQNQGEDAQRCYLAFRWVAKELRLSINAVTLQTFTAQLEELGFGTYRGSGVTRFRGLWLNPAKIPASIFDFETENENGDESSPPPQFLN